MANKNIEIEIDVQTVKKFFKKGEIRKIAKKSGFIQRERKLDAFEFFTALTFGSLTTAAVTIDSIAENLSESISRAGINSRFNKYAYKFLSEVFSFFFGIAFENRHNKDIDILNKFDRINIIDSSSWKVPAGLKDAFPGYNGAGCKIQLMFDYKSGIISLFDITEQTYNDQKYSGTLCEQICENDLLIFDMGYSIANTLNMIDEKGAFFVSRFNYSAVNLYIKEGSEYSRTDISEILKKLNGSETVFEFECYAGNESRKVKIRFFAVRIPEQAANGKRRRMYQNAKKKGRTPAEKPLKLCDWNFFMTNIPAEKGISVRSILAFYPVRWSAELFFRQFKSVLNIHRTEVKNNEYRLRCEVIGKAIAAMFISYCYSEAGRNAWKIYGEEISFDRTVKYFKRNISGLTALITVSAEKAAAHARKMIIKITDTYRKKRQKTRKNSLDVLIDGTIYENCEYKKINLKKLMSSAKKTVKINFLNININIKISKLTV